MVACFMKSPTMRRQVFRFLLENGADQKLTDVNGNGKNSIMCACTQMLVDEVKLLRRYYQGSILAKDAHRTTQHCTSVQGLEIWEHSRSSWE